jgi:hypothetical protein
MTEEQISALIEYVRAAVRAAVADAQNKNEWARARFDAWWFKQSTIDVLESSVGGNIEKTCWFAWQAALAAQPEPAQLDPDSDDAQGLAAPEGYWRGFNRGLTMRFSLIDEQRAKEDEPELLALAERSLAAQPEPAQLDRVVFTLADEIERLRALHHDCATQLRVALKERDDALSTAGITHGVYPELYRLRAENEALRDSNAAKADRIDRLGETVERLMAAIKNPPKHKWWGAGEPDCPKDIKASNGELHTLRCKVCETDQEHAGPFCLARSKT